jgi:hypothetical protein
MYSLILLSALWPNVIAELDLGPAVLEAQLGGGAFMFFGLVSEVPRPGPCSFPICQPGSSWARRCG